MTLVRGLIEQVRRLWHEIAKFGVIGGIGFLVTELGFNLCHFDLKLGLFTSNAIATVAATVITFVGNKYWTFRHRSGHGTRRETVIFVGLNAIGMLIQYAAVWIAEDSFGVKDKLLINVAFLCGIALATLFRFWSYRRFVWHAAAESPPVEESSQRDLVYPR